MNTKFGKKKYENDAETLDCGRESGPSLCLVVEDVPEVRGVDADCADGPIVHADVGRTGGLSRRPPSAEQKTGPQASGHALEPAAGGGVSPVSFDWVSGFPPLVTRDESLKRKTTSFQIWKAEMDTLPARTSLFSCGKNQATH